MFKNVRPLEGIVDDLLSINSLVFFMLLCLITFLLLYTKKNFVEYEITAFQILDERGQLGMFKMISALQYLSIPAVYMVKFTIFAFFLWVGCFGFGYKVTYAQCWQIVMVAEIIFVIPELMKIIWFVVFRTDPIFAEVRAFYPFSVMHFFDFESLDKKWHYPAKATNLFEVISWIMIIAGVHLRSGKEYVKAVVMVVAGYIIPFIVWLGYYVLIYK